MDAVLQTMVDEKIGPGERRKEFLSLFSSYVPESKGGITLRSYPDAIMIALRSLSLAENDKVAISILSPNLYLTILSSLNLDFYLCDIDVDSGCISLEAAQKAVNDGVKAFLVHEPLGQIPFGLQEIKNFGLPIIEDMSESIGSQFNEFKAGIIGDISICSFEEDGLLSTAGGAVVVATKEDYFDRVKKITKAFNPYIELPDMNAALGIIQLLNFGSNLKRRYELHTMFKNAVMKTHHTIFGNGDIEFESNGYNFSVVLESNVDEVINFANKYSVSCKKSFSMAVGVKYNDMYDRFPSALSAINRAISFPLYPFLQQKEQEAITKVLSHLP